MVKSIFTAALLATTFLSAPALADDIPVNKVILSTSGLAHFEHTAKVSGDARLEFPVRFNQVDDILKSLVVFDPKGTLGGVTLPGKQPLEQIFRDLPFTREQLSNPMMLLNAYQGAAVTVKSGAPLSGKLVQVEPFTHIGKDGASETRHRISLMTDAGLRQAVLEEAESLQFSDARIRGEIARALEAIRENGSEERRVLTVNLQGDTPRNVTFSYVVDAPLWKSSYRMVLPESGKESGLIQGWAVVENMTAGDWKNVDLTLVSGNPVTFRQNLYQSYYVDRPEIPVQVFGRVMPRIDSGTVASAAEMESAPVAERSRRAEGIMMKSMAAPAPAMMAYAADAAMGGGASYESASMADNIAQITNAAQSAEATTQVLFRFPGRFDLTSGQSMMVPFVSRQMPMSRVSLYQPETHATHPLAAVEVRNDGKTGVPPGVLTIYEESALLKGTAFVGDAQMPALPAGEKRLLPYALDSKVSISRENKSVSTEGKIAISQGVVRTAVRNILETVYTVKAPDAEDRTVIIEHPRAGDYRLVTPDPKTVEIADNRYRISVSLKAGEKKTLPVVQEHETFSSYGIESMSYDQLFAYAQTRGDLSPEVRKEFEALASLRRDMDAIDQQIYPLDEQRRSIFNDQERVRENLKALSGKSDIQSKYLDKLSEQEELISDIDAKKEKLQKQRRDIEAKLKEKIAAMSF